MDSGLFFELNLFYMKLLDYFSADELRSVVLFPYRGKVAVCISTLEESHNFPCSGILHGDVVTYVLFLNRFSYHYPFYTALPKESYKYLYVNFREFPHGGQFTLKINKKLWGV